MEKPSKNARFSIRKPQNLIQNRTIILSNFLSFSLTFFLYFQQSSQWYLFQESKRHKSLSLCIPLTSRECQRFEFPVIYPEKSDSQKGWDDRMIVWRFVKNIIVYNHSLSIICSFLYVGISNYWIKVSYTEIFPSWFAYDWRYWRTNRLYAKRFSLFFYSSKCNIYSTTLLRSMLGTTLFQ